MNQLNTLQQTPSSMWQQIIALDVRYNANRVPHDPQFRMFTISNYVQFNKRINIYFIGTLYIRRRTQLAKTCASKLVCFKMFCSLYKMLFLTFNSSFFYSMQLRSYCNYEKNTCLSGRSCFLLAMALNLFEPPPLQASGDLQLRLFQIGDLFPI